MKLYCIRHCEALTSVVDPERPLSEKGLNDANALACYLQKKEIKIPRIMHSGINRAKQTAEVLASSFEGVQLIEDGVLLGENTEVLSVVQRVKTWTEDTALVGHMPYMSKLVQLLIMEHMNEEETEKARILNYVPGTMVCLTYHTDGHWMIDWIHKP